MEARYHQLLDEADADPRVRVGILTGAGASFCPGVDTGRLTAIAGQPMNQQGRRTPARPWAFRKPLIAAINGGCAGMGLVQAMYCDLRFAARGAKLTTAFSRRGLAAEFGASWLLPRLVGVENALDLMLSGRVVDADEAHRLGLVSRVVEPDELLPAARSYAADMAAHCSPLSLALIRAQLHDDLQSDFGSSLQRTYKAMGYAATAPDFREGVDSYLEKRPAAFPPLADDFDPRAVTGGEAGELSFDPGTA
ncbi:MAG: putative enoyl-CoA hydratase/isomerase [Frankiales bacterium]|nr:putative enoyl-CoA hydratase/isomerase [Frankiales bacterium]